MPPDDLGVRGFLDRVADYALDGLPTALGEPSFRRRFTMLQVHYGRPKLHHELWVQRKRGQIEMGLHLEGRPDLNGRLLQGFTQQMPEIQAELGPGFEPEQWTKSWCRVHSYVACDQLDENAVEQMAAGFVAMVSCLEPRLRGLLDGRISSADGRHRVRSQGRP
jgi:hypothetical protein